MHTQAYSAVFYKLVNMKFLFFTLILNLKRPIYFYFNGVNFNTVYLKIYDRINKFVLFSENEFYDRKKNSKANIIA